MKFLVICSIDRGVVNFLNLFILVNRNLRIKFKIYKLWSGKYCFIYKK